MEERMYQDVLEFYLKEDNKKINYDWNLDEYLNTFTNKVLTKCAIVYFLDKEDYSKILEIENMANKEKSYIIDCVKENLSNIISSYVKILPNYLIKQLRKLIKNNGCISCGLQSMKFSIQFLDFLKKNVFARVYLDKKNEMINVYMPEEIVKIVDEILNNKEIMKANKKCNRIYDFVDACVDTYGILTVEELNTLCKKFNFKIDAEELINIVSSHMLVDDSYIVHSYNQTKLICNIEFYTEDEAFDFYEKLSGNLNLKFSLKDMEDIKNCKYIYKLRSYKKLINWLNEIFGWIKEDSEYLDCFIINDYISSAQINIEIAEKNFRNNIDGVLELDPIEKNIMANMLKDLYDEYPKWSKRGNV